MPSINLAHILLVEDNPGDVDLTCMALRDARTLNRVHVASDGVEALEFLRQQGPYATAPRPDLILLDLNMPRMDGRELLALIKTDPQLRRIPVVVLSTSDHESDIVSSYDLHANCFLTKPADLAEFDQVARSIDAFWLTLVKLPPH
jgi:two-component system, chemotaxis family, response regulator Rcp1